VRLIKRANYCARKIFLDYIETTPPKLFSFRGKTASIKAMHIIAGRFKNHRLMAPKGQLTRPTSSRLRESVFNILQNHIEGAFFLDLFAGSGAMGLEAISRGAEFVSFVDKSKGCCHVIEKNIEHLGVAAYSEVLCQDVFLALERMGKASVQFDLIYADPPYDTKLKGSKGSSYSQEVIHLVANYHLLKSGGMLFLEDSRSSTEKLIPIEGLDVLSERSTGRSSLLELRAD